MKAKAVARSKVCSVSDVIIFMTFLIAGFCSGSRQELKPVRRETPSVSKNLKKVDFSLHSLFPGRASVDSWQPVVSLNLNVHLASVLCTCY